MNKFFFYTLDRLYFNKIKFTLAKNFNIDNWEGATNRDPPFSSRKIDLSSPKSISKLLLIDMRIRIPYYERNKRNDGGRVAGANQNIFVRVITQGGHRRGSNSSGLIEVTRGCRGAVYPDNRGRALRGSSIF